MTSTATSTRHDDPYEYVNAWFGTVSWTREMLDEYLQAAAYWQGRADERAIADAEWSATLAAVFGGPAARTPREGMARTLRELDAQVARRRADTAPLAPYTPTDWPDAVVRLPAESVEHHRWRCRQADRPA
jgi:hypothetical protein